MNESDRLTLQIFNEFDGFPNKIIREAKQPEDDIRIASLALMQSIAYHTWGVKVNYFYFYTKKYNYLTPCLVYGTIQCIYAISAGSNNRPHSTGTGEYIRQ